MVQALSQLNNEFVEQVDTISATSMDIIENSAMQMYYSSSVRALRTRDSLTNAQRMSGLRDLGNFVSCCPFVTNVMIYNQSMNYIFTSDSDRVSAPPEVFYDKISVALLTDKKAKDFAMSKKNTSLTGGYYSFIFNEPNIEMSGSLLMNVRADWYERQLLGISSGDTCAILDVDGKALAAGSDMVTDAAEEIWPTIAEKAIKSDSGFILDRHTSKGWMYCKLKNSGWFYLRSFDTDTVIPSLTQMRNLAFALLSIVCSVLVAGSLYTLIKLYAPFIAVRQALKAAGESEGEITQQVDHLLESNLEQRLLKQFERILSGEEKGQLHYPISLVIIDSTDINSFRNLAEKNFSSLAVMTDFGCAALLFAVKEEQVSGFCSSVVQKLSCCCFYGHPRTSAEELSYCRNNLNELWQLRFLYAGQQILSEKLLDKCISTGFQPEVCAPLFSALRAGQLEEARNCWKEIFNVVRQCHFSDFRFAIRYIIKSLNKLYKEISEHPLNIAPNMVDELNDISQLHLAIDEAFVCIIRAEENRKMKRIDRLAEQINHRIAMGYSDDCLSAQHIADEMGMSSVYLGRLFRQSTGISISEAINRARVENQKSCCLLPRILLKASHVWLALIT